MKLMKTNIEKEINKYLKAIKKELPFSHKEKKKFFSSFQNDVWEFYHNNTDITIDDIYNEFGSTEDLIHSFVNILSPDSIIKHYKLKKMIKTFIIILLLLLIIMFAITEFITYMGMISEVEITIN